MPLDLSDLSALNATQEEELAKQLGVSIEEVMARNKKPCPPAAKKCAKKLMPVAISAATRAAVLRRRGVLSPDAENNIRQIVGHLGIFLGKGTIKSTFTTLRVFGEQDGILAKHKEGHHSQRPTEKMLSELHDDLIFVKEEGKELERIASKSIDNYPIAPSYVSIAAYVQGLSETALLKLTR